MRDDEEQSSLWVASSNDILALVSLADKILNLEENPGITGSCEDAKLSWLIAMLERHPSERFLLFTESLQTCEALQAALGTTCRLLVGSMSKEDRNRAVADLRNPLKKARVLVATSAADEGFDLQIACKVIHWDLSSSPATLMQRNGRVARLGQVKDVTAYYLILTGTHEDRRDTALQERFGALGIHDESLKNRILGSLTEEEESRLEQAIENSNHSDVGHILEQAKTQNETMDNELDAITEALQATQVLSREDLARRLAIWKSLGLPSTALVDVDFSFDSIKWERPVFAEVASLAWTESVKASFRNVRSEQMQELVFDPDYLLFGPKTSGVPLRLAGIPPWVNSVTQHGRHRIAPYIQSDLLGKLLQGVARLPGADFLSVRRNLLGENVCLPQGTRWMLFCTHPLRESENVLAPKQRPFLTFYSFPEFDGGQKLIPIEPEGADADTVNQFLLQVESLATAEEICHLCDDEAIQQSKNVGIALQSWVESVTRFGATRFLDKAAYFVPIPVALVCILE